MQNPNANTSATKRWTEDIFPYVESTQIFDCPSGATWANHGGFSKVPKYTVGSLYYAGNYSINGGRDAMPGFGASDPRNAPIVAGPVSKNDGNADWMVKSSMVQEPAPTVWVADGAGYPDITYADGSDNNSIPGTLNGIRWNGSNRWNPPNAWPERHLETTNVLYANGHVKAVKLENFMGPKVAVSNGFPNETVNVMKYLTNAAD